MSHKTQVRAEDPGPEKTVSSLSLALSLTDLEPQSQEFDIPDPVLGKQFLLTVLILRVRKAKTGQVKP